MSLTRIVPGGLSTTHHHTMNPYVERLNLLAAALMTAVGAHALLCLASLPSAFRRPQDDLSATVLKALVVLWALAGVIAGVFVILQALGLIHARKYQQARTATFACIILPLLGPPGMATAFALVPLGTFTLWLLNKPDWQATFVTVGAPGSAETQAEAAEAPE